MTTIAFRDGVVAADTALGSGGGSIIGDTFTKIAYAYGADDRIIAIAAASGRASYACEFLRWAQYNGPPDTPGMAPLSNPPEAEYRDSSMDVGALYYPCGNMLIFESKDKFWIKPPYFAIGSGRPEALGAMHAGADAMQAVMAAIAHDPHTAGSIYALSFDGRHNSQATKGAGPDIRVALTSALRRR